MSCLPRIGRMRIEALICEHYWYLGVFQGILSLRRASFTRSIVLVCFCIYWRVNLGGISGYYNLDFISSSVLELIYNEKKKKCLWGISCILTPFKISSRKLKIINCIDIEEFKSETVLYGCVLTSVIFSPNSWFSRCVFQDRGQELVDGLKVCLQGKSPAVFQSGLQTPVFKKLS